MFISRYGCIAAAGLFALLCRAQPGIQDNFISPAPPDFSTSLNIGENFRIEWTAELVNSFGFFASSIDPTNASLWITTYNGNGQVLIKSGINVEQTLQADWRVAIPSSELRQSTRWVFRFLAAGEPWVRGSSEQISSVGVTVRGDAEEENTSSETTQTTPTPTDGSETSPSRTADAKETKSGDQDNEDSGSRETAPAASGLSGGAIAGIVIGTIGVIVLAAGLFFIWRHRRRPASTPAPAYGMDAEPYVKPAVFTGPPVELPTPPAELSTEIHLPSELVTPPPKTY